MEIIKFLEFLKLLTKKNEKAPKCSCDLKEDENTFGPRMWLKYDEDLICEWCVENKQTLVAQNVVNSNRFIDGCTTYKMESIS